MRKDEGKLRLPLILFMAVCKCVFVKARRISTASGSERDSAWSALATARGTNQYTHLQTDL